MFVPRTAPGDQVTLTAIQVHSRFARARVAAVVTPGPGRTAPPCPHYVADHCGGCQLMHLDLAAQRAAKSRIVGDALRRIGKLDVADPEVVAAPAPLGYRTKVTFTVQQGVIGYHRLGEAGKLFEVRRCLLMDQRLDALHQQVRGARDLLPVTTRRLVLRLDGRGGRHLIIRSGTGDAWTAAAALAERLPAGTVIWWHPEEGVPRAVAGGDTPWPATVFEQVHPAVAAEVRRRAIGGLLAGEQGGAVVWDLYAGIGESTALLARAGHKVHSVEIERQAVELATQRGPAGPDRRIGDVVAVAARLPAADLVLTNPPRTGMAPPVTSLLAASEARRIVYVSCDPATLARDIRALGPGWQLTALTAFDQFPETAHVECVATLERRGAITGESSDG